MLDKFTNFTEEYKYLVIRTVAVMALFLIAGQNGWRDIGIFLIFIIGVVVVSVANYFEGKRDALRDAYYDMPMDVLMAQLYMLRQKNDKDLELQIAKNKKSKEIIKVYIVREKKK